MGLNKFRHTYNDPLVVSDIAGRGTLLNTLNASNLTGSLPAISGSGLTSVSASSLTGPLPAISGANLTSLSASNLSSGTLPNGVFPATLPTVSGANLTSLNASNLSSGTISNSLFNSNSNAFGTRTVTTTASTPTGGTDGDIWYTY